MRRSPSDYDYGSRVSVQRLEPLAMPGVLDPLASIRRLGLRDVLGSRQALHAGALGLALLVVAAASFAPAAGGAGPSSASGATAPLGVNPGTAIIAHALPFTAQPGSGTYTVQAGDTLTSIARGVGVSEEALLAYNGLTSSDALTVGLQLLVPDLSKVPPDQLRLSDTLPHDSLPPIQLPPPPLGPQKPSPDMIVHQILKGDTVSKLAALTGVSISTILDANNLRPQSILSVGQQLMVPSVNGQLVTIKAGDTIPGLAERFGVPADALIGVNKLNPQTTQLEAGTTILIPANPGAALASIASSPMGSAAPAAAASASAAAVAVAGPPAPAKPQAATGAFIWPATGVITTYFSSWHNGIDIANSAGTPVHAAEAGVVTFSGWDNTGFGYMVRIDHGNGYQSLYGHSEKLLVKAGQSVDQGEVIMLMGSTGNSTGPHVHFSIFKGSGYNGVNPLQLLP